MGFLDYAEKFRDKHDDRARDLAEEGTGDGDTAR
jgi:hypothetical protein